MDISIEFNDDADKIEVDENDVDEIFTFDDERHNGKPITMLEISPKEKYLITYSNENRSIVGWNVEDMDKVQLEFDQFINEDSKYGINSLCVSDDKKLAYIDNNKTITVIDMNHKDKNIALSLRVLDTAEQTKNNKWECKRFYRIPKDYELISILKYDKVYLFSNDYIYEWNINTERGVKIFGNNKDKNKFETKNIGIFSNEKLIFLKINDKIIIYSIELKIPIASLDINDDIRLYNFMNHTGLFLLPSLFYYTPDEEIKYCWSHKYKNSFNQTLFDKPTDEPTDEQTKFVFGFQNGCVWKSKFDEKMSKMNLSSENSNELNKENNKIVECDEYFKTVHSFNLYMDTVSTLLQKAIDGRTASSIELAGNLIKWDICVGDGKIKLEVFKKGKLINMRIENFHYPYKSYNKISNDHKLLASSLFSNDNIIILTTFGILIYTFSENNKSSEKDKSNDDNKSSEKDKSIFLNYFYFMKLDMYIERYYRYYKEYTKKLQHYERIFSKSTLPLPNYDSFRLDGWASDVINNKSSLLKYGAELLKFAIKDHKLELIDDIYKKCMTYFKKDLMNNKSFLSIITSAMPLLDEYYPEYILKYSSEMNMIIDSSFYNIEHQNKNLHLYSFFQSPQLANLSKSLLWTKFCYNYTYFHCKTDSLLSIILYYILVYVIQSLIVIILTILTLPLYLATFYISSKYNFINNIYGTNLFSRVYFYTEYEIFKTLKKYITTTPTITFMIPYINFVNYSKDYNWFLELIKPQPSPFTETINRNIYKTWNGEALINFKWNAYGKYYYAMIWILYMALLGCFTTAATIPQQYINEEVRQQLFIASIILGFIHLILKIRQFFYNITKWFYNFWNIFDIIAYVLSIYTSIYWLQTNNKNNNIAFKYFGVYFAIIISVEKMIFSFLLVLFIIIISFAHAFYILLSPKSEFSLEQYNTNNNDDPNNPWNLGPSYSQVDNNGNINSNPLMMIQIPDENTNMFMDIKTSLFAVYLFLIGDSSALSNWTYTENPSIAILIVLFSLLVVVYLMNLLIGLLNIAIEKDNNRVSYLMQKAEILAEIELFYLLPHQRRWQTWFPEVIHYYADVDKTRIEIERLIEKGEWDTKEQELAEMQKILLDKLKIEHDPIDNKVILEKLKIDNEKLKIDNEVILEKLKSYDEKLDKLDKLEELEKLLKEIRAK
ncbi:hypothetical protein C1646_754547 [Rhizophagus diaphanus]|nr:hypothetical protein C1646_754547 [Rhizophagus diaphanus] [Rhizophagus sp. MUCL 43196]